MRYYNVYYGNVFKCRVEAADMFAVQHHCQVYKITWNRIVREH